MDDQFINLSIRIDRGLMERIDKARYNLAKGFEVKKAEFVRKAIERFLDELEN